MPWNHGMLPVPVHSPFTTPYLFALSHPIDCEVATTMDGMLAAPVDWLISNTGAAAQQLFSCLSSYR